MTKHLANMIEWSALRRIEPGRKIKLRWPTRAEVNLRTHKRFRFLNSRLVWLAFGPAPPDPYFVYVARLWILLPRPRPTGCFVIVKDCEEMDAVLSPNGEWRWPEPPFDDHLIGIYH